MSTNQKPEAVIIDEPQKDYLAQQEDHEEGITEGALAVVNAAEINQQIATAKRYPRYPAQFRRRVYEMSAYNMDVAESCIYALPRDGKMIDGPSIRFAEILQTAWGNCRSSTEVTDIGEEFVTSEGVFFDLESNSAVKAKILRRITNKHGKRYSADMIATTGNAACSIALRNAILRGIPRALWYELFDETKKVAAGTQQTFAARRDRVFKDLGIQGATPDMIFALLGITGINDVKTEHVVHLRGLQNAIKDGETTIDEAFIVGGPIKPATPKTSEFTRTDNPPEQTGKVVDMKQPAQPPAQTQPAAKQPEPVQQNLPEAGPGADHGGGDDFAETDEQFVERMIAMCDECQSSAALITHRKAALDGIQDPAHRAKFDAAAKKRETALMYKRPARKG